MTVDQLFVLMATLWGQVWLSRALSPLWEGELLESLLREVVPCLPVGVLQSIVDRWWRVG